jgi:hypothetical protein
MEILLGLGLLGVLGYGAFRLAGRWSRPQRRQNANHQQLARHQEERRQRINLLARNLQLALLRLEQAPDFRRAASFAGLAQEVPLTFRQRQFRRFRPLILRHFVRRLREGADPQPLAETLAALVQHLGIPAFEADYLRTEGTSLSGPERTYGERIAGLQAAHAQRRSAIAALPGLNAETREQLLEAEDTRFQEALQAETNHASPPAQAG